MATHHIHCIAVMKASPTSRVNRRRGGSSPTSTWFGPAIDSIDQTAATIAGPVISVEPATPLLEAARLMLSHRTPHLLVIEPRKQRPVGILSTLDIAGVLAWGEA